MHDLQLPTKDSYRVLDLEPMGYRLEPPGFLRKNTETACGRFHGGFADKV